MSSGTRSFYRRIKRPFIFSQSEITDLFSRIDQERVHSLSQSLSLYIKTKMTQTIARRNDLKDYKTNPYVLLTSASAMDWDDIESFAGFLFNSKLYAGLETSFGKVIEAEFIPFYPTQESPWLDPPEKTSEQERINSFSREERARARDVSVWREIDKTYTVENTRYLLTIKSGPHCINDTQVEAMKTAISTHYLEWFRSSVEANPEIEELHIVIGITYGTEKTTNNKENQILVKLLEHNFIDSGDAKGTVYHAKNPNIKVYRVIGKDFWALIGNPNNQTESEHVFLEILLGLLWALNQAETETSIEALVNEKIHSLARAIERLALPRDAIPPWINERFSANELLWLISAISTFYDEGITTSSNLNSFLTQS